MEKEVENEVRSQALGAFIARCVVEPKKDRLNYLNQGRGEINKPVRSF